MRVHYVLGLVQEMLLTEIHLPHVNVGHDYRGNESVRHFRCAIMTRIYTRDSIEHNDRRESWHLFSIFHKT